MINIEELKVLAVDDNAEVIDKLWEKLKASGLKIDNWFPCSNLIDAKEKFKGNSIHYCIIDLELPRGAINQISEVKNGVEFAEYVCNQRKINSLNCSYTILSGQIPNPNWLKLISVNNDAVIQKDGDFVNKVIREIEIFRNSGKTPNNSYSFPDILKNRIQNINDKSLKENLKIISEKLEVTSTYNIFTDINDKIVKELKNYFVVKYRNNIEIIKRNIKSIHSEDYHYRWDENFYIKNKQLIDFSLLAGRYKYFLCDYETSENCIISPKVWFYTEEFNKIRNQEEHGQDAKEIRANEHIFHSYFTEDGRTYANLNEKNIYDNTLAILLILPLLDLYIKDNQG